jgi:Na+-translocating ferredoxin:NAD+ oxidoreductase RnfG subunit
MRITFFIIQILLFCQVLPVSSSNVLNNNSIPEKKISRAASKLLGSECSITEIQSQGGQVYFKISNGTETAVGSVRLVKSCNAEVCGAGNGSAKIPSAEYFEYFLIADNSSKVLHVEVFNYQSTKGHEIMSRSWLRQFVGYKPDKNLIFGRDIDGVSGATISARAITEDIPLAVKELQELIANSE